MTYANTHGAAGTSLAQTLRKGLLAVGRQLTSTLLPQNCALCGLASGDSAVCAACSLELPRLADNLCARCALPLGSDCHGIPLACPDCTHHTPDFDSATAAWSYGFPIDTLIRNFKYGHHLYLGRFLGQHLAQALQTRWDTLSDKARPDLILPMPLHPIRLKERGFNQAAEITRHTARCLDLPWRSDVVLRTYHTAPQAGLHRAERWANLRGAFACTTPLNGAHILLVDDVLTTGASLSACATALRHAGASQIDVAVLARTPEPGHPPL